MAKLAAGRPLSIPPSAPPPSAVRGPLLHVPGWPVCEPGLLMMALHPVVFIHLDGRLDERSQRRYLAELAQAIGHRGGVRVAVLYHIPVYASLLAMAARGEVVELLRRHEATLRETTACFALVTPSALIRAAVQAVFAMSRQAFPQKAYSTVRSALDDIARTLPATHPSLLERRIEDELAAYESRFR
jgi:hypothetical protein